MSKTGAKTEYIYVIAEKTTKVGTNGFTGYYKVGRTDNLRQRLSVLQTGNPHKIEYWQHFKVANVDAAEQAAHRAVCEKYRSDEQGGSEWYSVPLGNKDDFIMRIQRSLKSYS